MSAPDSRFRVTLPSDPRFLALVRAFVAAVCQAGGFDAASTHAIVLAVHEAAGNVIRHAHRGRAEVHVHVECYLRSDGIEIHLLDEGEPFDIAAVPFLDPAEIRPGGRGVFLMRRLMDEISSQPRGPRGNTLRLVKRRTPTPPLCDAG